MTDKEDKILTVQEVADLLKVSAQLIRNLIKKGVLPGLRVGGVYRIYESSLDTLKTKQ